MSATVTNSSPATPTVGGAGDGDHTGAAARELHPEAVVFPREGKPLDQRPVDLRQERATTRYREDGRPRSRRERS